MTSRMATVRVAKAAKMKKRPKPPPRLLTLRPMWITMVQSTSESSAGGRGEEGAVSGGVVPIHFKQKLRPSKLPLHWGGEQEGQQLVQPSVSGHCLQLSRTVQGRAFAQQLFASFSAFRSIPPFGQSMCKQTLLFTLHSSQLGHTQLCPPAVLES